MTLLLLAGPALVGCGVPAARHAALADAFDGAAAARDRAQAELDACAAAVAARAEADRAAEAPREAARTILADAAPAVGGALAGGASLEIDPAPWFLSGTADLTDDARTRLAALARALVALPPGVARVEVAVGDPVPTREHPAPRYLSADRAIAVVAALEAAGVPAERLVAAARAGAPILVVTFAPAPP